MASLVASQRAINVLSVSEVQEILTFRLGREDLTSLKPTVLEHILGGFLVANGHGSTNPGKTTPGGRVNALTLRMTRYHLVRSVCIVLAILSVVFLKARAMAASPVAGAVLRLVYWIIGPIAVLVDRATCAAHAALLHRDLAETSATSGVLDGRDVLLVYWHLMEDALVSALVLLISAAPVALYGFRIDESFLPAVCTGLSIMLHTITSLKRPSPLHSSISFWLWAMVSQRIVTALTYSFNKIAQVLHINAPILRLLLLFATSTSVCFASYAVLFVRTHLRMEQQTILQNTDTSASEVPRKAPNSRQVLRVVIQRLLNATYSAIIAALSIFVSTYSASKMETIKAQHDRYNANLVLLSIALYSFVICLLQSRALICFLRCSTEWDKRVEPYLIFYPLAIIIFSRAKIMTPMKCGWSLIVLLLCMHVSFVNSVWKDISLAFKFSLIRSIRFTD